MKRETQADDLRHEAGNVVGVSKREQDPSAKGHLTHLNDTLSTITNAVLTHKTEEGGCIGLKSNKT